MRHLAIVLAIVAASAFALADDANAAPLPPNPSTQTVGPITTTGQSFGSFEIRSVSDVQDCFSFITGDFDPFQCDDIELNVTAAGTVEICVAFSDPVTDPDIDIFVFDQTFTTVLARAVGQTNPECVVLRVDAAATFQVVIVPFFTFLTDYTATFTYSAPVQNVQQNPFSGRMINGGGRLIASPAQSSDPQFSINVKENLVGKSQYRVELVTGGKCDVKTFQITGATFTAMGVNNGRAQITAQARVIVNGVTDPGSTVFIDANDLDEPSKETDFMSVNIPEHSECDSDGAPLRSGGLHFKS